MGCCPGPKLAEFFENGIGKFLLILFILLVTFYSIYFTCSLYSSKDYPPNTFIEFKQDQDYFLGKNEAGYKGYIRFETDIKNLRRTEQKQSSVAKIVLDIRKDVPLTHAVKIELFDKNNAFILESLLKKEDFVYEEANCSYNILDLKLAESHPIDTVKYFRFSLINDKTP